MTSDSFIRNNRFLMGLIISVIFHLILFVIFQFVVSLKIESPLPENKPLFITVSLPGKSVKSEKPIENRRVESRGPNSKLKSAKISQKNAGIKNLQKSLGSIGSNIKVEKESAPPLTDLKKAPGPIEAENLSGERGELVSNLNRGEIKSVPGEESKIPEIPAGVEGGVSETKSSALPFKPGVEIEEQPMAFNLEEVGRGEAGVKGKRSTSEAEAAAGTGMEKPEIEGGGPYIEWENTRGTRKVISFGPKPKVPEWVKREGLKLSTTVIFKVDPGGKVVDLRVIKSSGYSEIDAEVVESVRRIVFEPVKGNRMDTGKITYVILPK